MDYQELKISYYICLIGIIALFLYHEHKKSRLKNEISFYYQIGYFLKLQRTLFLCEFVLEILSHINPPNVKTKKIFETLKTKGLGKYIDDNKFYFCDDMYFELKDFDNVCTLIQNFQNVKNTIEWRLNSIKENGFFYFHPPLELPWDIEVNNQDDRFMPTLPTHNILPR